jgi:hypothetical protein
LTALCPPCERGDGGITDDEGHTLEPSPRMHLFTIPGKSFFTQCEEPALVADLILQAIAEATPSESPAPDRAADPPNRA